MTTTVLNATADAVVADALAGELETRGVVVLPPLVSAATLADMQRAFAARLDHLRWNDCDGYERTEVLRLMVPDVLTLAQGFIDIALHPIVKAILRRYLGDTFALCEAKGWQSLPTVRDRHGWHGDSWYDQETITDHIPREVKLAFYLTDVKSGAFAYLPGTHQKTHPRLLSRAEQKAIRLEDALEFLGPAGTAILFDTSGVHRQNVPIREPRQAVFLNYHDPRVPLQRADVEYYRYHPLLLNAAFLGGLAEEDANILGFGDKTHYQPGHRRRTQYPMHRAVSTAWLTFRLHLREWTAPIWRRLFGK